MRRERLILLLGLLAVALLWLFARGAGPSRPSERPPPDRADDRTAPPAAARAPERTCTIEGPGFRAELSTHGASLRHYWLLDHRFDTDGRPEDLVTTTLESRAPLRTDLELPLGVAGPAAHDALDWTLGASDEETCTFTYADEATSLTKTVTRTGAPYELAVTLLVKNTGTAPRAHRLTIEETSWQTKRRMSEGLGRRSPHVTEVVTVTDRKTETLGPRDLASGELGGPEITAEGFRRAPGHGELAAVSSVYFAEMVAPIAGPSAPVAEGRIEERWDSVRHPNKSLDPSFGYVFRARLAYPPEELAPSASVTYRVVSFAGPKERDLLASFGHGATSVLHLGTFAIVARALLACLRALHGLVHSWGFAIILLTVAVRLLLFPFGLSQARTHLVMRRLAPEMDAINDRYKDDAARRALALRELWREHRVSNPALGCLPLLLQLPIWWALYAALGSAVELYHVPFGPIIPDLTAPAKYFVVPLALGVSSHVQQRLAPAQVGPMQRRLMLYSVPAIFTFMTLLLPAGLGVYMLTSTVLAILQQRVVGRWLSRHRAPSPPPRART